MLKKIQYLSILFCLGLLQTHVLAAPPSRPVEKEAATGLEIGSVEERRILLALREERRKLNQEKEFIAERKNELKRLESEVDKKLDELKRMREELRQLLADKDAAEEQRIAELSKIYQKMSPDRAAAIMVNLKEELAVSILNKMKIKSAAQVLSRMGKDKAVRLTTSFSSLDGN